MSMLLVASLFFGIVRADGSVVPIATHDGTAWHAATEPATRFERLKLDGDEDVALAWAGDIRPARFTRLHAVDERATLVDLRTDMIRSEETAVRDWNRHASAGAKYPIADAGKTPLDLRTAVRSADAIDGWIYTFIEGIKRYPGPVTVTEFAAPCSAVVRVQAVTRSRQGAALKASNTEAEASVDCLPLATMRPLALFRHEGTTYWVVRFEFIAGERSYGLVRVTSGGLERLELRQP